VLSDISAGKFGGIRSQGIEGSYNVAVGNPARSIMKFSKRGHIDLVVMTTHGKSGLKRAIMGSVADAVIRESGKPVLVIRPQSRR
jgi:nucleotide-binding universal stress UspA family protein